MKDFLRYFFAIPLGVLASIIIPAIYTNIIGRFVPFEFANNLFETYLLPVFAGYFSVLVPILIVPKYKIHFGVVSFFMTTISIIYLYLKGDDFNYLFLLGSVIGLILGIFGIVQEKKDSYL